MADQFKSNTDHSLIIHGGPTKELFINLLVRDILITDAIGDLIDNSVDSARETKVAFPKDSFNFNIDLTINENEFIIKDNCGGFDVETARERAFKIGKEAQSHTHQSIGRFGIGMKRALFKLGTKFEVSSRTKNTFFQMNEDIDTWKLKDDWDFKFEEAEEKLEDQPKSTWGTIIKVKKLRKDVEAWFSDEQNLINLKNEIEKEHIYSLAENIKISLNEIPLQPKLLNIIDNDDFKPARWKKEYENGVKVELIAGIAEDNLKEGGWYIFCNGRLVVGPDTTEETGWTGQGGDGVAKYHEQYNRFRGYAFFNADDAGLLPWNTTKTGMDMDSPIYINVRQRMIEIMRPIMTFLNKLKAEREKDAPKTEQPLNNLLNTIKPLNLNNSLSKSEVKNISFSFPQLKRSERPKTNLTKITYSIEKEKFESVKDKLRTTSAAEVGIQTFNYFFTNEIEY